MAPQRTRDEVATWLIMELTDGPEQSSIVMERGRSQGFTDEQIAQAVDDVGVLRVDTGLKLPPELTAALARPKSLAQLPWRTGRSVGRTIYAMIGSQPSKGDPIIGLMDSVELANEAVDAHNRPLNETTA